MLVSKQQQLHALHADSTAQKLLLENQLAAAKDQVARLKSNGGGASSSGATGFSLTPGSAAAYSRHGFHDSERGFGMASQEVIPIDSLGEPYQRLARHRKLGTAVQAAAGFLDRTAASAVFIFRQYPLARLLLMLYAIVGHLLFYVLVSRMQHQALRLQHSMDDLDHHHALIGDGADWATKHEHLTHLGGGR